MGDYLPLVYVCIFIVAIVMLFAQVKLFEIAATLRDICDEMRSKNNSTVYDEPRTKSAPLGL